MRPRNVKRCNCDSDIWVVTYLEKCRIREIFVFTKDDIANMSLEKILEDYPKIDGKDLTFRAGLRLLGEGTTIPATRRLQKKFFKRKIGEN